MVIAEVGARVAEVRERVELAVERGGHGQRVTLIAVTKTHGPDAVEAALEAGIADIGENKVQEALQKIAQLADTTVRWHLVGHLQSNKVRKAAAAVDVVHAIDGLELLRKVDGAASAVGRTIDVLVQVDARQGFDAGDLFHARFKNICQF